MPCIECENGKWKWGESGECRYDSKEECERANQGTNQMQNAPRATVPPRAGPVFSRPMAVASSKPRQKRRKEFVAESERGKITAKAVSKGRGEITIFGTIGFDWFGEGITSAQFDEAVKALGDVSEILVRANSGGGDVFEGTQIYNILVKHPARIVFEIEGVAASAMTLITMSGDEIHISENAHWMIHRASGGVWGNDDDVEAYLKLLRNANELLRLTYSRRTGLSDARLVELMRTDNWMTPREALDLGFVDALDEAKAVEPHIKPDGPEDRAHRPVQITSERLAAMSDSLAAFARSAGHRVAASATPTGGSPQPVTHSKKEPKKMNAKLRAKCIAAGMDEKLDGEAADKWLDENFEAVMKAEAKSEAKAESKADPKSNGAGGLTLVEIDSFLEAREKRQVEARKAWRKEVDANIALAFGDDSPADLRDDCYALQADGIEAVRTKIQEAKKKSAEAVDLGGVRLAPSQPSDRHLAAIRTGLVVRCLSNGDRTREKVDKQLPEKDRPEGYQDFQRMPFAKLAEECLYAEGWRHETIRRLTNEQIVQCAMGFGRRIGIRAEGAVHTTGSLAEITRDAMNKVLQAAYAEAPETWRGPFRQASSVPDFKEKHVIKLSAAANVPVWPDNTAPELVKLSNEKESYAVEAHAETISFSWRLGVNDDLDALSRHPQIMGNAMKRTVNAVAWLQVTSNPTMADGQALFLETPTGARFRSNLTVGSATPTNTTIGAMKAKMRLMRGLNTPEGAESEDVLNLMPAFIVGPAALEEVILKQVLSDADPASGGNSAVYNTSRTLTPIIEPLLDANSAKAWYLFASPSTIDTGEVTFMLGHETPVTHEWMDDATMSQNFTIIQAFQAKMIDHRGVQKHAGE